MSLAISDFLRSDLPNRLARRRRSAAYEVLRRKPDRNTVGWYSSIVRPPGAVLFPE